MIRLALVAMVLTLAAPIATALPAAAACMVRVPGSLSSDSERVGPTVPCNARQAAEYARKHPPRVKKARAPKVVDPLKLIRNDMVAGRNVSYKQLRRLADSGDELAAYKLAQRIEDAGEPSEFDTALAYYAQAVEGGREFAVRPVIRMLEAGAAADKPKLLARTETLLAKHALKNVPTRDALIKMYRDGAPFGQQPEKADELLIAAAEGGDARAALDLAFALLSGTPDAAKIEQAKAWLEIAKASDELNLRTMAENLLRTLDPQQTASAETTP